MERLSIHDRGNHSEEKSTIINKWPFEYFSDAFFGGDLPWDFNILVWFDIVFFFFTKDSSIYIWGMEAQSGFFIMFMLLSIFSILGLLWSKILRVCAPGITINKKKWLVSGACLQTGFKRFLFNSKFFNVLLKVSKIPGSVFPFLKIPGSMFAGFQASSFSGVLLHLLSWVVGCWRWLVHHLKFGKVVKSSEVW